MATTNVPTPQECCLGRYVVESFQIPVPGGDCSIHLLLEDSPESNSDYWQERLHVKHTYETIRKVAGPEPRGKVVSAVLVDGGHDGGTKFSGEHAADAIKVALEELEKTFGTPIKFTSWVVTHWDRDHYSGSLRMIIDDLQQRFDMDLPLQSKYMIYQGTTCLTTLYCPFFGYGTWNKTIKGKPKGRHWMLRKNLDDRDDPNLVDFLLLKKKDDNTWYRDLKRFTKNQSSQYIYDWIPRICRVCEGYENLAGVDFFSPFPSNPNERLFAANIHNQDITFQQLLDLLSEMDNPQPRFLCVGAEGYVMGSRKNTQNVTKPSAATLENFISIMSLIVWPAHETNNDQARVSYFGGGDSFQGSESRLSAWLGNTHVCVVKASHHGSHSSTPSAMLENMKPSKVIISAGYEYGHPNWTIIALLYAFWWQMEDARKRDPNNSQRFDEKVAYTLRHPYYLDINDYCHHGTLKLSKVALNMSHNLPKSKLVKLDPDKNWNLNLNKQITDKFGGQYVKGGFLNWHLLTTFAFCQSYTTTHATQAFMKSYPFGLQTYKMRVKAEDIKVLLHITVLREFWEAISPVDQNWSRSGPRKAIFIWTRHSDNPKMDGRVSLVQDWVQICGGQNPQSAFPEVNGDVTNNSTNDSGQLQKLRPRITPQTTKPSARQLTKTYDDGGDLDTDFSELSKKSDKLFAVSFDDPNSDPKSGREEMVANGLNAWGYSADFDNEYIIPDFITNESVNGYIRQIEVRKPISVSRDGKKAARYTKVSTAFAFFMEDTSFEEIPQNVGLKGLVNKRPGLRKKDSFEITKKKWHGSLDKND
ncbi:uncharacterized protein BHQ10_004284 [Talaromyces amestolkiae]|uniref:Metallo-beta-lactamase domain-containing protein n=1 Tax=Talaromyces amestolkiae TaxID=1196081 RepID=A0A364KXI5_TALAM|nr:uncharacterized protein BHQ10_004284 [Talaromyces amestolkiae]RAO68272.1 hypothetical protein BHQ10_004284 [Talaromyces amestolkiae]